MEVARDNPAHYSTLFRLCCFLLFGLYHVPVVNTVPFPKFEVPDHCKFHHESSLICVYHFNEHGLSPRANISHIISEYITSIHIMCEDGDAETPMNTNIIGNFLHVWRVRDFCLTGCKLGFWSSKILVEFHNLRNFALRENGSKKDKISLELEHGTFEMNKMIEKIDLSSNNMWQLPEKIFCPLSNLVTLNVSWNILKDVVELGFGEFVLNHLEQDPGSTLEPITCPLDIKNLDVSNNQISILPSNGFSLLKRLRTLNISKNVINIVGDDAFRSLRSLEVCDLSSNRIVALPTGVFQDAANTLKELYLQNNSISALAPGLVANMNQLVTLDLSKNMLTSSWINSATFMGLIRLVSLDLSHNQIDKLDPAFFRDLYTLQILNLKFNQIEIIPADTFSPMSNLHTLELSHNKLTYLGAYSLNGLYAVSLLSLNLNTLEGIHPDAFKNCSSMKDLNLSGNILRVIPVALRNMRMLKTLDLGENQIKNIENPGFQGMSSLYGLRMIGNEIVNVTRAGLGELPALQILNLARNKIEYIEYGTFSGNSALQAIRIDANYLQDISGIFANAPGLLWLNISDNMISHFDYGHLPKKLQWIDIHKNLIMDLGVAPQSLRLQSLDVSHNRLTRIHPKSVPNSIELLFINDNMIHTVESHTFHDKENLTRVDLYANQIVKMDLSALQLAQVSQTRPLPEFYIGGNPFICDCTIEWLQRINSLPMRQHPRVVDLDLVYCHLPYDRQRSFIPLLEAESSQFLCSYRAHCFALCHCCDFDACDCEMTCPSNCKCYHDQSWFANVVDCSNSGYKSPPGRLPMDATEVYLDGNNFGEMPSHSFIGRKNLEVLYANNSNICAIHAHTFSGLKRLVVLHLENNKIERFNGSELLPAENLRELHLQNNILTHIDNKTFQSLHHLEILKLENNRLSSFDIWQLDRNPHLIDITISNNPWTCECTYLDRLRIWMLKNQVKVTDWREVTCQLGMSVRMQPNGSAMACAAFTGTTWAIETTKPLQAYLPLLLVTTFSFVSMAALIYGVFKYRSTLRMWVANQCGLRACYKTAAFEDREKPFDAYISYSAVDENFVSHVLVPGLENSYRLCLHYRDLGASAHVADAVTEAADSSRRTILILSRNFLRGEWSRLEFKAALREALKGKGRSVILLLVGGICPRDLDTDLRRRISSHTVLVWEDKLFWQKLKFAMPDVWTVFERPRPLPPLPTFQHLWT